MSGLYPPAAMESSRELSFKSCYKLLSALTAMAWSKDAETSAVAAVCKQALPWPAPGRVDADSPGNGY